MKLWSFKTAFTLVKMTESSAFLAPVEYFVTFRTYKLHIVFYRRYLLFT